MNILEIAGEQVELKRFGGVTWFDFTVKGLDAHATAKLPDFERIIRAKIVEMAAKIQAEDAVK